MKIDYVVPFVNGEDTNWQKVCGKYSSEMNPQRCRDWGTLKYQLRSIEKFLPWINNLFIILSIGKSQIPDWLNLNNPKIHIIYDTEIIPKEYLPTFNSNTIDLYVPNIKGLSNHYLYACDDYIILRALKPEDFFSNDKIKLKLELKKFKGNIYSGSIYNSVKLLYPDKACLSVEEGKLFVYSIWANHTLTPHIKDLNKKFLEKNKDIIEVSLTQFRKKENLTWLIYPLNAKKEGLLEDSQISVEVIRCETDKDIENISLAGNSDILVVNDEYTGDNFKEMKIFLEKKMQEIFTEKCSFEI